MEPNKQTNYEGRGRGVKRKNPIEMSGAMQKRKKKLYEEGHSKEEAYDILRREKEMREQRKYRNLRRINRDESSSNYRTPQRYSGSPSLRIGDSNGSFTGQIKRFCEEYQRNVNDFNRSLPNYDELRRKHASPIPLRGFSEQRRYSDVTGGNPGYEEIRKKHLSPTPHKNYLGQPSERVVGSLMDVIQEQDEEESPGGRRLWRSPLPIKQFKRGDDGYTMPDEPSSDEDNDISFVSNFTEPRSVNKNKRPSGGGQSRKSLDFGKIGQDPWSEEGMATINNNKGGGEWRTVSSENSPVRSFPVENRRLELSHPRNERASLQGLGSLASFGDFRPLETSEVSKTLSKSEFTSRNMIGGSLDRGSFELLNKQSISSTSTWSRDANIGPKRYNNSYPEENYNSPFRNSKLPFVGPGMGNGGSFGPPVGSENYNSPFRNSKLPVVGPGMGNGGSFGPSVGSENYNSPFRNSKLPVVGPGMGNGGSFGPSVGSFGNHNQRVEIENRSPSGRYGPSIRGNFGPSPGAFWSGGERHRSLVNVVGEGPCSSQSRPGPSGINFFWGSYSKREVGSSMAKGDFPEIDNEDEWKSPPRGGEWKSSFLDKIEDYDGSNQERYHGDVASPYDVVFARDRQKDAVKNTRLAQQVALDERRHLESSQRSRRIEGSSKRGNVLFITLNYPVTVFTNTQMNKVINAILEEVDREPLDGTQIRFKCFQRDGNYLSIKCNDSSTRMWVERVVPELAPWPGAQLILIRE